MLGLFEDDPAQWLLRRRDRAVQRAGHRRGEGGAAASPARDEARKAKDFAEADRMRGELKALGVEIMDTPGGHHVEGGLPERAELGRAPNASARPLRATLAMPLPLLPLAVRRRRAGAASTPAEGRITARRSCAAHIALPRLGSARGPRPGHARGRARAGSTSPPQFEALGLEARRRRTAATSSRSSWWASTATPRR